MIMSTTSPPTAPPTIAATFVFFELSEDGDSVGESTTRVADLAVKVGLSV
jgi:hypothetical protein